MILIAASSRFFTLFKTSAYTLKKRPMSAAHPSSLLTIYPSTCESALRDIGTVMARVNEIDDLDTLVEITKAIHTAKDISEILALLK